MRAFLRDVAAALREFFRPPRDEDDGPDLTTSEGIARWVKRHGTDWR